MILSISLLIVELKARFVRRIAEAIYNVFHKNSSDKGAEKPYKGP